MRRLPSVSMTSPTVVRDDGSSRWPQNLELRELASQNWCTSTVACGGRRLCTKPKASRRSGMPASDSDAVTAAPAASTEQHPLSRLFLGRAPLLVCCTVPYRGAAGDSDAVAACRAAGSARGTWVRASPPGPAGAWGRPHLHRAASCAPHRALTARGDRVLAPLISARLRSRTARVLQSAPADTGTAGPASLAGAPVRTAAYSPNPSSLHGAKQVCGVRMCVRA